MLYNLFTLLMLTNIACACHTSSDVMITSLLPLLFTILTVTVNLGLRNLRLFLHMWTCSATTPMITQWHSSSKWILLHSVYVFMCVGQWVYMFVYVHLHLSAHTYILVCVCVRVRACVHAYVHLWMYVNSFCPNQQARSYGVMVSTPDSESGGLSSSLSGTYFYLLLHINTSS